MKGIAFFDTNVLVYADDASSPAKQQRAITLFAEHLQQGTAALSLQVLQEHFAAVTRKLKVAPEIAHQKVEVLARSRVVRWEPRNVIAAIELHRLTRVSFWDALIVQAARSAGAPVLYSEDFQTGALLGGIRVVNPF